MGRWRGRRCAAVVVYLLAFVASASDAQAQYFGRNKVHYDRLDFRVLRTEHFDIYYYAEEEEATQHAARMAERWYARFSRVLDHRFVRRQPIVLYASHPHFAQTNVSGESPGEGTGGLTERNKSRIAMPFAAGLGETDHVLGHEIAHAFQLDIARNAKQNAFALPSWFIEGMAEYLSLGPTNTQTSMWLRDAALYDQLPTLEQLSQPKFFPYRYGHAFWSYLAASYGDGVLSQALRSRESSAVSRIEKITGKRAEDVARGWHDSIVTDGLGRPRGIPRPHLVLSSRNDDARFHMAPALSPDGRSLAFVSERDRLSLDLFVADASTGHVTRKLLSTAADPHFDSLQYIHSSGAWDRSGRRFALTALSGGDPILVILETGGTGPRLEVKLNGLGEAYTPSWSPDGSKIVFSALKGGLSDLFIYNVAANTVDRLTADAYADLQPAWSPDGQTIALVTDRFTSTLDDLRFGAFQVALLDIKTGVISPATEGMSTAKQISPQWSPDGRNLYFISDATGISNVMRFDTESGEIWQVTAVAGGVSGITSASPALAIAADAGTVAFTVYRNGRYEIQTLEGSRAAGGILVDGHRLRRGVPAIEPAEGTIASLLTQPMVGLPPAGAFESSRYDDRLRLETLAQPYIGASTGSAFGGMIRAHFGIVFGDMLRDRQLQMNFRAGTSKDDFAAQVGYLNRKGQWNWGVVTGFAPSRFVGARRSIVRGEGDVTRATTHLRYANQWASLASRFNIDRSRRFEMRAGIRRTGYEWQTVTRVIDVSSGDTMARALVEAPGGQPVLLGETEFAYVQDTAVTGPTGPVLGQRLRLEVDPAFGGLTYTGVRVDARRYIMPIRPLTIAARVQHVARYGPGAGDPRLTPLLLGLQSLVRGYDLRTYAADECGRSATSCSLIDELAGSRVAVLNLEARMPLMGLMTGDLDYGRLPVELIAFADAGMLWTTTGGVTDRDRFRSIGAGARVNVGGIVFEMTAAKPFDRVQNGWTASLLLRPGF